VRVSLTRRRGTEDESWLLSGGSRAEPEVDLREGDLCALRLEIARTEFAELIGCEDVARLRLSGAGLQHSRYEESNASFGWHGNGRSTFMLARLHWSCLPENTRFGPRCWMSVHTRKTGREAYEQLLADLFARAENVILGATAAQLPITEADVRTPLIARMAMLQAHFRELERSFAAVALSPNRRLVAEREDRPLDRARRIDTQAFRGLSGAILLLRRWACCK